MSTSPQLENRDSETPKSGSWHWLVILIGVVTALVALQNNSVLHPGQPPLPPFIDRTVIGLFLFVFVPILAFLMPWGMKGLFYAFCWDGKEHPTLITWVFANFILLAWWGSFWLGTGGLLGTLPALLPAFQVDGLMLAYLLSQSIGQVICGWNGMRIFRPILAKLKAVQQRDDDDNDETFDCKTNEP